MYCVKNSFTFSAKIAGETTYNKTKNLLYSKDWKLLLIEQLNKICARNPSKGLSNE